MAFHLQNTFSLGEVSDKLLARIDFDGYYKAARKMQNLVSLPEGGFRRRFGLEFLNEVAVTGNSFVKVFQKADGVIFFIVFSDYKIFVYNTSAVLISTVNSAYTSTQLAQVKIVQNGDSLIIVHPEHAPAVLYIDASQWFLVDLEFKTEPTFDFKQNYGEVSFTFYTRADVYGVEYFPESENTAGREVYVLASSGIFEAGEVGGFIVGLGAICRITSYTNSTSITVKLVEVFDSSHFREQSFHAHVFPPSPTYIMAFSNPAVGKDLLLTSPIFNSTRGYPQSVTIFQDRLVFGGTPSLPQIVCMSVLNSLYGTRVDFNTFGGLDTDAIIYNIASQKTPKIVSLLAAESLLIFTTAGVFSTPILQQNGITPTNFALIKQTNNSASNISPVHLDNQMVFIERNTEILRGFAYSSQIESFDSVNMSLLSQHLIMSPSELFVYHDTYAGYGDFAFVINGDGSIAAFHSISHQNVNSWTSIITDGEILSGDYFDDYCVLLVKRNIDGVDKIYLEKLDFTLSVDSTKSFTYGSDTNVITGLDHLEGKEVFAISGYKIVGNSTVTSGQITLDEDVTSVTVGLNFDVEFSPMPPVKVQGQLYNIYAPQRIGSLYIDFMDTLGLVVNDIVIPDLEFPTDLLDPVLKTGVIERKLLAGWNIRKKITIKQNYPYPFTILALGYIIE